jgi:N-acetylglutamate synthase
VAERIASARRWYEARGLPAIFRVNPLTGPALAAELDRQGWSEVDHSLLMAMELGDVQPDPRGAALPVDDPVFLDAQRRLKGYDDDTLGRFRAILAVLEVPARGIIMNAPDGRVVATALMAVADAIVVTGNVVTDPGERRKGYGASMMTTGLAWAREAGATHAALNVEAKNEPALALYRGLGYSPQYGYVYRYPGVE